MYKCIKILGVELTVNKFPKTAKKVSRVYLSGLHKWGTFEQYNYSVVIGVFRIVLSVDKKCCCGEI
jgi:hypothetical protein